MSKSSDAVKKWRDTSKQRMVSAMGGKCQGCGYDKCIKILSFHHLDPSKKDIGFGAVRANPISWKKLVIELRKCIMLCMNCHGEIHAGVREIPKDYHHFDESFVDYKKIRPYNQCSICGSTKPESYKFCSQKCAKLNSRKVNWDNVDLLLLLKSHSMTELGNILGVSSATIYKRRNKLIDKLLNFCDTDKGL